MDHHSVAPKAHAGEKFRITIRRSGLRQAVSHRFFNISAMSFGALSPNAVAGAESGAKKGGFAMTPARAASSPITGNGSDIIWEIGPAISLPQR